MTGLGVGRPEVVTARVSGLMPEMEPEESGRLSIASTVSPRDLRVLATGRAGSGPEGGGDMGGGGLFDGRWGMADVIVVVAVEDIGLRNERASLGGWILRQSDQANPEPQSSHRRSSLFTASGVRMCNCS